MGQQTIPVLKDKFADGKTPTGGDFGDFMDSYIHKSTKINQGQVLGLDDSLKDKATKEDLANATTNFKGYHTSLAELLTAYPQAQNRKDFFAWVGSPYPGTVYKVFADGGAWTDTGEVPTQEEIDLAEYIKISDLAQQVDDTDNKAVTPKAVKIETTTIKDTLSLVVEETNNLDVTQDENNLENGVTAGGYWNSQDKTGTSANWKRSTGGVRIPSGSLVRYEGGLYGDTAGIIVKHENGSYLDFIIAGAGVFKDRIEFTMPNEATHVKVSWLIVDTYGKPLPFKLSWKDKELMWHVATKEEFTPVEKTAYDAQDTITSKLVVKGANQEDIIYNATDFTWANGTYYTKTKEVLASTRWKRATNPVAIIPNTKITLNGEWYGQSAGCCVCDKDDNVVQFVCSPSPSTNIADAVQKIEFVSHADADRIYISYMKENGATFDMLISGKSPDKYFVTPIPYLDALIGAIINNSDKGYNYVSIVTPNMESPLNPQFMDTYFCVESGNFWGLNYVKKGSIVYFNGTEWVIDKMPATGGGGGDDGNIPENTDYDVIIIGGGAGGVAAAYALKNTSIKVALIESDARLGGNHLNAWINVHATTPPPPFLKPVIDDLMSRGKAKYVNADYQEFTAEQLAALEWKNTYLRTQYTGLTEACISLDVDANSQKYYDDLSAKIDIFLNTKLVNAEYNGKYAQSITYSQNDVQTTISSKYYIDATGDNVLLRLVGGTRLQGTESKTTFLDEYGFSEANAADNSSTVCNAPTLMYRVVPGTEDLSDVQAGYSNDALGYFNPDQAKVYFNTVSYLGNTGIEVVQTSAEAVRENMSPKCLKHWKTIKNGGSSRFTVLNLPAKKFDIVAPKLGVRETYRAKCERMLNENHLYVKISAANIKEGGNLDKKIACGNHLADIHGDKAGVNVSAINAKRVPYGVPYGSLIPKGLNNLFVASRGAGLTHLGASSFRLNKDIMQLGWAAGHAAKICVIGKYSDTRDVDVEMLQNSDNTDFANTITFLETIMK